MLDEAESPVEASGAQMSVVLPWARGYDPIAVLRAAVGDGDVGALLGEDGQMPSGPVALPGGLHVTFVALARPVDVFCSISTDLYVDVVEPLQRTGSLPNEEEFESKAAFDVAWARATLFERLPPCFDFQDVKAAFCRARRAKRVEYVAGRNPSMPDASSRCLAVLVADAVPSFATEWIALENRSEAAVATSVEL